MIPNSREIRIEIINSCQYNCVICKKNQLTRRPLTMKIQFFEWLIDKIIKERKEYDTVSFAGIGEPTLNGGLIEMIKYCTKRGLKSLLVSNGEHIDERYFLQLQKAGLTSLRISFHGATPEGYRKLHGVDNFHKVKNNIEAISNARETTKLLLTWAMAEGVNEEPIKPWLDMFEGKADLYEIWKAHNWIDEFGYRKKQEEKVHTCGRLDNGPLQVQVDGTVNACCFDWNGQLVFGDLKNQSLKEIFMTPMFEKAKACHESGDFAGSNLICERCDQRNKDKSDVLIYSSGFDLSERVGMTSTAYERMT